MDEEVRLQKMLHNIQIKKQMVDSEKANRERIEHWQLEEGLNQSLEQEKKMTRSSSMPPVRDAYHTLVSPSRFHRDLFSVTNFARKAIQKTRVEAFGEYYPLRRALLLSW